METCGVKEEHPLFEVISLPALLDSSDPPNELSEHPSNVLQ